MVLVYSQLELELERKLEQLELRTRPFLAARSDELELRLIEGPCRRVVLVAAKLLLVPVSAEAGQ